MGWVLAVLVEVGQGHHDVAVDLVEVAHGDRPEAGGYGLPVDVPMDDGHQRQGTHKFQVHIFNNRSVHEVDHTPTEPG